MAAIAPALSGVGVSSWQSALANRMRGVDRRWTAGLLIAALAIWGLTDVRSRGRVDPAQPLNHKTDVTVYTGAGAAIFAGQEPYGITSPRGWHYLYPPLFAIFMAPLAVLDPQWQAVAFFAISVLAAWGSFVEMRRLWNWLTARDKKLESMTQLPRWAVWAAAGAMFFPAMNCLQRGQTGLVILYPLVLGIRLVVTSSTWRGIVAGGIALALPVAIKLTPALPAAFICMELFVAACISRRRNDWIRAASVSIGVAAGLFLFFLAVPSLFVGPAKNIEYLHTWLDRVAATKQFGSINDFAVHSKRNQSLTNAFFLLGNWTAYQLGGGNSDEGFELGGLQTRAMPMDAATTKIALIVARLALLGLLLAAGYRAAQRGDPLSIGATLGLAAMATVLISPLSWAHHYVIWLAGLWLVPLWLWREGKQNMAQRLLISACALTVVHYVALDWAGRVGVLGIGATVWFIAAAVAIARKDVDQIKLPIADEAAPARLAA